MLLPEEEQKKFPVICPYCHKEQQLGDFAWLGVIDDLDIYGKTVMCCVDCKKYYVIRDDGDGPFMY